MLFIALKHPQRRGKVFMAFMLVCTLMQKNNDLWTNEVTGFPYKQTAIIFSTLWLWVPLPHLSMSMWPYLLKRQYFCPFYTMLVHNSAGSVIYPTDRKCMTDTIFLGPKPNRTKIRK